MAKKEADRIAIFVEVGGVGIVVDSFNPPSKPCGNRAHLAKPLEATDKEVIDALKKLVCLSGGKVLGTKVMSELAKLNPALPDRVHTVGGLKSFCEKCVDVEFVSRGRGCGFLQWRERSKPKLVPPKPPPELDPNAPLESPRKWIPQRFREVCDNELTTTLLELVDAGGGKLLGSRVMGELGALGPALLRKVEAAGGISKFCETRSELAFVKPDGDQSCGWVQRRKPEPSAEEVVEALLKLADDSGGRVSESKAMAQLAAVNRLVWEKVEAAGGPSAFCSTVGDLEFVPLHGPGCGWLQRRLQSEPTAATKSQAY